MNIQPRLFGELVTLRPLTSGDFEDLFRAASDPLIWELHPQADRYKPEVFKVFFEEALASKGALAIIDKGLDKIIGTSRYYDYSEAQSSIVIGYTFLARKYWGGRVNRDLKTLMVNYALRHVGQTFFHVGLKNLRSQNAMLKLRAINTGIQEVSISYGPPKKSYVFRIDKPLY